MKKFKFPILLKVILAGILVSFVASGTAFLISYNNQVRIAKETMQKNLDNTIDNLGNFYSVKNNPTNIDNLNDAKQHVKDLYDKRVTEGKEYELNDPRFHGNFSEFEKYYKEQDGDIYDIGFGFYPGKGEFQAKYHTLTNALTISKITSNSAATYCAYADSPTRLVFIGDSRQIEYEGKENNPFYHMAGSYYEFADEASAPNYKNADGGFVTIYNKTCKVFSVFTDDEKTDFVAYIFVEYDESIAVARVQKILNTEMLFLGITAAAIVLVYALISYFLFVRNINKLSRNSKKISRKLLDKSLNEPEEIRVRSHDEMNELAGSLNTLQNAVIRYAKLVEKEASEREKINAELEVASRIQLETLPPSSYLDEKLSLKAYIKTAKEVGGDFYDYFYIDESKFAVLIADVSGKGVPAALFMMRSKAILKNEILSNKNLDEAICKANNILVSNNKENLFVTAFIGVVDLNKHEISFVNAGHEKPYIISKGKVHKLDGNSNFVIGEIDPFKYHVEKAEFNDGDLLVMFTDGLNESINKKKEEFGYKRIEKLLSSNTNCSLDELFDVMSKEHQNFIQNEEQFDDITIMAIKLKSDELHLAFNKKDYSIIEEATNAFFENYSSLDESVKSRVGIVLDELLNNQVSYEKREDLQVNLDFSLTKNELKLVLTSNGEKFNPFTDVKPKSDIGGHGISLVKNLTKKQKYSYEDDRSKITLTF